MPIQVVPIEQLASVGLIEDIPPSILPPNAFTEAQNVRFHDESITLFNAYGTVAQLSNVVYVAYWPATTGDLYVVVTQSGSTANVSVYEKSGNTFVVHSIGGTAMGGSLTYGGGEWQHTIFNGGYHIILNNGAGTPVYLQADITSVTPLPGWDSYASETSVMNFVFDGTGGGTIDVAFPITIADGTQVKVSRTPRNVSEPIRTGVITVSVSGSAYTPDPDGTIANVGTISSIDADGFVFTPANNSGGDEYAITIVSDPISAVTAGVVRAYGNLLVAGNLKETGGRTLTGTVRTSDIAAPGQIPTNWNPFNLGVNTADEFILASTGEIQDMVELQGVLYVYTDSSIHSIQQTGSPVVPFQVSPVTDNYGADGVDSVIEVDGKHIVIGNDDVYVFTGHPGNNSSIADGKVRDRFRSHNDYKVARYNAFDELWFFRPNSTDVVLVWNYRSNVWTTKTDPMINNFTNGRNHMLVSSSTGLGLTDSPNFFYGDSTGTAHVGRRELAMVPSLDTEMLSNISLLISPTTVGTGNSTLTLQVDGTDDPGLDGTFTADKTYSFQVTQDYKTDTRVNGRFLNYRITLDNSDADNLRGFKLGQIQLGIGKGGQR